MWLSGRNLVVHRKPGKGVSIQQVKCGTLVLASGFRKGSQVVMLCLLMDPTVDPTQ